MQGATLLQNSFGDRLPQGRVVGQHRHAAHRDAGVTVGIFNQRLEHKKSVRNLVLDDMELVRKVSGALNILHPEVECGAGSYRFVAKFDCSARVDAEWG